MNKQIKMESYTFWTLFVFALQICALSLLTRNIFPTVTNVNNQDLGIDLFDRSQNFSSVRWILQYQNKVSSDYCSKLTYQETNVPEKVSDQSINQFH